jgi:UDP-glucose 4-epimerase
MKVLVTGGAGFIGSHVVEGYLAAGLEVVVVDRLVRGFRDNLPKGVPFYVCDVQDRPGLVAIFDEERPDVVNHHAAQIDIRSSVRDPLSDLQCNLIGSIHLLNLSVKYKVGRFILASTGGAIYGEPVILPASEETPKHPLSPYGINKRAAELYLETYWRVYGLPYVALRYGNVYGPRQSSKGDAGVVATFSDVVRANMKALEFGQGGIFNIASGRPTTDYQIYKAVREALKMPPVEPRYVPKRPGEVDQMFLDISKAEKVLTWKPKIELSVGIQRAAEWFQENLKYSAAASTA